MSATPNHLHATGSNARGRFETIKHRAACSILARELSEGIGEFTSARVCLEYPICIDRTGKLYGHDYAWDEGVGVAGVDPPDDQWGTGWVPTYEQCLKAGLAPLFVHDVMYLSKGLPSTAYEVVYRGPPSAEKLALLKRVEGFYDIEFVNAIDVLARG